MQGAEINIIKTAKKGRGVKTFLPSNKDTSAGANISGDSGKRYQNM